MKDRDTPLRLVRRWSKLIPHIYELLDYLKTANGSSGLNWPNFCDLPIAASMSILCKVCGLSVPEAASKAAELTACYTWMKNKIIYSFDEELSHLLAAQADDFKDTNILPAEVLIHPPHPCTFIKTDIIDGAGGFWYWIEYDFDRNALELRVQFVSGDMSKSYPFVLHLLPGKTIKECVNDTAAETARHMPPHTVNEATSDMDLRYILVALQFVLYIVSENADIHDVSHQKVARHRKNTHRVLDKASAVKEKSVGVRIGNAIRKAKSSSHSSLQDKTGLTKRPHSRRGHWHHYWVGPKNGERSLILKWIAPTVIHEDAFHNDTVVVFPVK